MNQFENYLKNNLPTVTSFHPHYEEAMRAMLLAGGKRFRPMLLLSIVEAYEPQLVESSLRVALAIEYIHTYSLVHDDLPALDNASFRRGHPTLHTIYDERTAILVGDGLNTDAFYLLATSALRDDVKIKLIKILSANAGIKGMVLGQAIDLYFEKKELRLDEVKFLHIHKTAKLIATSIVMGAIIVGLSQKEQDSLYQFGLDLGLLFQIQDDIIDETQTTQEAGKTTNNDEDKNSFIKILGLDGSIENANDLANKLHSTFQTFEPKLQTALSLLMEKYLYRHIKG
ncbi:MAG: polyprenyl synthetase family protein [Epsilonproteobacteria bacterium]|nr:polyprenyl synthetase family protein [Campylobacterota bacterium]